MELLNRENILQALDALAAELAADNQSCELFVVGGAALVLLYGAREATKDVDAFASSSSMNSPLRAAAAHVARTYGLPEDWLNDAAKGFVHGLAPGPILWTSPACARERWHPTTSRDEALPWRDDVDIDDARLLLDHLAGTRKEIWNQLAPHLVPGRELKAQYAFDDLWEKKHGPA